MHGKLFFTWDHVVYFRVTKDHRAWGEKFVVQEMLHSYQLLPQMNIFYRYTETYPRYVGPFHYGVVVSSGCGWRRQDSRYRG